MDYFFCRLPLRRALAGFTLIFSTWTAPVQAVELGPRLQQHLRTKTVAAAAKPGPAPAQRPLNLIAQGTELDTFRGRLDREGFVHRQIGDVLVVTVPPTNLRALTGPEQVSIDLGKPLFPLLDRSIPSLGIDASIRGERTGRDVIVAVLDTGIDMIHEDFRNSDGSTRMLLYWDQAAPPRTAGEFGIICDAVEINRVLLHGDTSACPNDPDDDGLGFVPLGHGSHVAGIAVGSDSKYRGVAPEAMLIGVRIIFDEGALILALEWVKEMASLFGKPVVVNLSLGSNDGGHDGRSASELVIDELSGPRYVVVAAAGNERGSAIHVSAPASASAYRARFETIPLAQPDLFHAEIWTDTDSGLSVAVALERETGGIGAILDQTSFFAPGDLPPQGVTETLRDGETDVADVIAVPQQTSRGEGVRYSFVKRDGSLNNYRWHLAWTAPASRVDAWLTDRIAAFLPETGVTTFDFEDGSPAVEAFLVPGDLNSTVTLPGTSREAITVTGFVTRKQWPTADGQIATSTSDSEVGDLLDIASIGPTRDGRIKPDIAAPGEFVVSTLSAAVDEIFVNPSQQADAMHWVQRGTSMAGPHVAGLIALLLQENDTQSPSQLKDLLSSLALGDSFTGDLPNHYWGAGKLSVGGLESHDAWRQTTRSDTRAPVISNAVATHGGSGATLSWSTDELADAVVSWGDNRVEVHSFGLRHEVRLPGNPPDSVTIMSHDPRGNASAAQKVGIPRQGCGCQVGPARPPLAPLLLLLGAWFLLRLAPPRRVRPTLLMEAVHGTRQRTSATREAVRATHRP